MSPSNVPSNLPDRPDAVSEEMVNALTHALWHPALAERQRSAVRAALQAARQEDPLVGEVEKLRKALSSCLRTMNHVAGSLAGSAQPSADHLQSLAGLLYDEISAHAALEGGET